MLALFVAGQMSMALALDQSAFWRTRAHDVARPPLERCWWSRASFLLRRA